MSLSTAGLLSLAINKAGELVEFDYQQAADWFVEFGYQRGFLGWLARLPD